MNYLLQHCIRSGNCFCTTKGVTGDHCEKCDTQNHYFGNPMNESCYYDLAIDYQFTFNLSKPEDKHYTAINFKNVPTKADVDVDFSISCSVDAKVCFTSICQFSASLSDSLKAFLADSSYIKSVSITHPQLCHI